MVLIRPSVQVAETMSAEKRERISAVLSLWEGSWRRREGTLLVPELLELREGLLHEAEHCTEAGLLKSCEWKI